jgi:solute carrier family 13 (sodium-dependent dicarboxylate transporter), member 2/3/5
MTGEEPRRGSWRAVVVLLVGIAAAAVITQLPLGGGAAAGGLSPAARNLGAIFVLCVVLWATEAIPVAVTALLAVVLQPLLGVVPLDGALGAFMSKVFFFVVAMFVIAGVVVHSGLDRRFALGLLTRAGTDPRRVLLALMVGTAALSSIMSDVPACAVFMAVGMGVLSRAGVKPGSSRFGKAVMMGIPIAALIGGVATPAGSSVNVIGLDLLHRFSAEHDLGIRVTFVQWMALGVPMVLVLVPAAWWTMLRFHPPELDSVGDTGDLARERRKLGPIGASEWKVIVILAVMVVLWVAGSWVKALDLTIVALCGAIVTFLPGVRLMDWTRAERFIGWNTLFMIGGVTSLGAASMDTGLANWLVSITMGGIETWPLVAVIALIGVVTVLIHLPLPIAPVVNVVLIPPVAALSLKLGVNPAVCVLPVAFTASCAFLLPLDAVPLLTYRAGYYRMFDMLGPGGTVSALWVVVMTALMLLLAPLVGLT